MTRTTKGLTSKARRKKVLKLASGYRGARSRNYRTAKAAVIKASKYAYRDRRQRRRDFRRLWIARINAAARQRGVSYSRFMHGLAVAEVEIDRKSLAELAVSHPEHFDELVKVAIGE